MRRSALAGLLQRRCFREPLGLVQRREQIVDELLSRFQRSATDRLHRLQRAISASEMMLQRIRPDVYTARMQRTLSEAAHRLHFSVSRRVVVSERRLETRLRRFVVTAPTHRLNQTRERVESLAARLEGTSYRRTLERGYSIARSKKGRRTIRDPAMVADGDLVFTETAGGEFESRVVNRKQMELFD